jgi:hypothetical protein
MAEDGAGGGNLRRAPCRRSQLRRPVDDPEHRWHAAHAAVAMHAALEGLNRRREAEGRGPPAMDIAAYTGEVFAGTRRAPRKQKYAVLAVLRDRVVVRDHGRVTGKGRGQPVEIYELMSLMVAEGGGPDPGGATAPPRPAPSRAGGAAGSRRTPP